MLNYQKMKQYDPEIAEAMEAELRRERNNIELIASENIVSPGVLAAMGSVLTNKYAEGLPAHRYYGGCECVDVVENLAIERAKQLFGAEAANVQPHSGANANLAAFFAFLQPGDTVMGMNLSCGGHLSHGSPVNISGKWFNVIPYGLDPETERIDYNEMRRLALENHPKLIVIGASAYPRFIDYKLCREICDEAGAIMMVDMAHVAGLVAAGVHPSPVPYADVVTTTTHKTLRGPRGGLILMKEEHAKAINSAVFPGTQGGPLEHIIAAKAVALHEALSPEFKAYQENVVKNAKVLEEELRARDIDMVTGGTDNHLLLLKLTKEGITGRKLERRLDAVGITANKNGIPNDPEKPTVTSGLRIGTPAVTTRGFGPEEMKLVAGWIEDCIRNYPDCKERVAAEVTALTDRFPIYS
ncbi:MAG: serine hydroxymethyltransferase [Lachnospiraceae bacterium]|nr:serine hydroxymethyltransferase [Lachnospiraceae bacterium]